MGLLLHVYIESSPLTMMKRSSNGIPTHPINRISLTYPTKSRTQYNVKPQQPATEQVAMTKRFRLNSPCVLLGPQAAAGEGSTGCGTAPSSSRRDRYWWEAMEVSECGDKGRRAGDGSGALCSSPRVPPEVLQPLPGTQNPGGHGHRTHDSFTSPVDRNM